MNETPEIAGLLYKKRGGFGKMMPNAWQYRFFTITKDGVLQYFDTEMPDAEVSDSKARGKLDLRSVLEVTTESIEGAPSPFPIQIAIPSEERWKLCASRQEDHNRWCKALEKFCSGKVRYYPTNFNSSELESDKPKDTDVKSPPSSPLNNSVAVPTTVTSTTTSNPIAPSVSTEAESVISATPADHVSTSVPITVENLDIQPKPAHTSSKTSKKRLKLASQKALLSQEWIEWLLVLLIVNLSFLGILTSRSFLSAGIFVVAGNVAVGYTLQFRNSRQLKLDSSNKIGVKSPATTQSPVETHVADSVVTDEANDHDKFIPSNTAIFPSSSKPIPGQTYQRADVDPRSAPPHTWSIVDSRQFNVRVGPDYNRFKRKAPSGSPFYEPFAVDVFCAKLREDHVSRKFELPDTSSINTHNKFVPPIFVIQIQIPTDPPASFFATSEDGPGWAVVMYFRITEETCNQLKDLSTASPAVKLFAEWCEKSPVDPQWRGRFKVINSCTNLDELGFPSLIVSYNAKPVLIRRTGSIFRGDNHMEMNIHVHKFANVAKQSIHLLSSRCGQLYMQIGFVIEGRDDKELPENLFACVAINRPQEDQAEFIFDD